MSFDYFDIHSHLNLKEFSADIEVVIARMRSEGVGTIAVGVDHATSEVAVALAEKYEHVYACVGMHPTDNRDEVFDQVAFTKLGAHPKVVAIGECGLDYFRLSGRPDEIAAEKEKQKKLFIEQIQLAEVSGKPLMIHARPSRGSMDAYEDVVAVLDTCRAVNVAQKANFHFFVGNIAIAGKALARGFTMSFDGPITFSSDYDDVIRFLPLESIMVETDAPFAAPAPYRGKRCEPWMIVEIVRRIAEIKEMPEEMVREAMVQNATRYFAIPL